MTKRLESPNAHINSMYLRACTQTCEHVCQVTHPSYSLRVCVCVCGGWGGGGRGGGCVRAFVRARDSVSSRVLCMSVCQFYFALYD